MLWSVYELVLSTTNVFNSLHNLVCVAYVFFKVEQGQTSIQMLPKPTRNIKSKLLPSAHVKWLYFS